MNKVAKPCFSNGSEMDDWTSRNCDHCIKRPKEHIDEIDGMIWYSQSRCKIYDEIQKQLFGYGNEPIRQITYDSTRSMICPYIKKQWPKHKKRSKYNNEPNLFK